MIYFDNAATTLIKPEAVRRAMYSAVGRLASPGRGGHPAAMAAAEKAYECRTAAAGLFKVPEPEQVVFTMNATHALNIAIKSLAGAGDRVVISGYEHNSVRRPLNTIGAKITAAASPLFDEEAAVAAFDKALTPETKLAVVNHVSNVFGFVLPVERIAKLCRERRIPLVVDASQAAGVLDIDFQRLGADFVAMPGHKGLYGPQGTGILLCGRSGETLMEGGSGSDSRLALMPEYLPDRQEAGTHNMPGIAGLLEGIRFVSRLGTERIARHEKRLLGAAVKAMKELDEVELYYAPDIHCQSPVLSFNVKGEDCQSVAEALAERGIAVRSGLHCSPLAHQTVGTYESGTVRLSFSAFNTEQEVWHFVRELKSIIHHRS
ncbi:MAG: aminotransferase class V-fold PLP-dependent enzyme [Clostridiales bacterium]|nr:aminotransferase class V-fold PLP-dependent enzyme [Clostridiales bacterium]